MLFYTFSIFVSSELISLEVMIHFNFKVRSSVVQIAPLQTTIYDNRNFALLHVYIDIAGLLSLTYTVWFRLNPKPGTLSGNIVLVSIVECLVVTSSGRQANVSHSFPL